MLDGVWNVIFSFVFASSFVYTLQVETVLMNLATKMKEQPLKLQTLQNKHFGQRFCVQWSESATETATKLAAQEIVNEYSSSLGTFFKEFW